MASQNTLETLIKAVIVLLGIEWAIKHQDIIQGWIDNFTMAVQAQTGGSMMMAGAMTCADGSMPDAMGNCPAAMAAPGAMVTPVSSMMPAAQQMVVQQQPQQMVVKQQPVSRNPLSTIVPGLGLSPIKPMRAANAPKLAACNQSTPCGNMCTSGNATMFACCTNNPHPLGSVVPALAGTLAATRHFTINRAQCCKQFGVNGKCT